MAVMGTAGPGNIHSRAGCRQARVRRQCSFRVEGVPGRPLQRTADGTRGTGSRQAAGRTGPEAGRPQDRWVLGIVCEAMCPRCGPIWDGG